MCFYRLRDIFMVISESWNPAALGDGQTLVMCWLSVRERGLPWGTCQECSEYEGLYWHAWCPFQTITKSRCHGVNVRTSQVTLLSFCSSVSFTKFSVEEFFILQFQHFQIFTTLLFCDFPLETIQTSCVLSLLSHLAVWQGMMCLILMWPSFLSSGSFCLLVAPLASPLGCREEWKAASRLVPL